MTNEELVEKLRVCAGGKCKERDTDGCWTDLMYEAADAIEELLSRCTECRETTDKAIENINKAWHEKYEKDVPKWIPVTERLPEYDTVCILTNGISDAIGYRGKVFGWHLIWTDYLAESDVTHWMPLPSAPPNEFFESLKRGLEQAINGETREITIEVEE